MDMYNNVNMCKMFSIFKSRDIRVFSPHVSKSDKTKQVALLLQVYGPIQMKQQQQQ